MQSEAESPTGRDWRDWRHAVGVRDYAVIFLRGWLQVTLVASNASFIAHDQRVQAVVGGFLISAVWWKNAHSAAHVTGKWAGMVYATGAAAGTMTGLWIAAWWR